MPQFQNTPQGGRPINVDESRNRLQQLMQNNNASPATLDGNGGEEAQQFQVRSRIMDRHKSFEPPPQPQVSPEEQQANAEAEQARLVETAHDLEKETPPDQTDSTQPQQPEVTQAENAQIEELKQAIEAAPEEDPNATQSTEPEIDFKKMSARSVDYWYHMWQKYVKDSKVTDEKEHKVVFEVNVPRENEVEIPAAEQMFSSMVGFNNKMRGVFETVVGTLPQVERFFKNPTHAIGLEIVADDVDIRFLVTVPVSIAEYVQRQINASYPDADIALAKVDNFILPEGAIDVVELALRGRKTYYPIKVAEEFGVDPLNAITSSVSKLGPGEKALIQFLIQPSDNVWRKHGKIFVDKANNPKDGKGPHVDGKVIEAISNKISRPGFRVAMRVLTQAKDKFSAEQIRTGIVRAFDQFSQPHLAAMGEKKVPIDRNLVGSVIKRHFPEWGNYPVLNTMELGTLYHFPNKNVPTPRIAWLTFRRQPPPPNLPTEGEYMGKSEFRGTEFKIFMAPNDRVRHLYIIGQTGTGKSEFLKHLAQQDIVNGHGLAFIDPHGDVVEELLTMIPKERAEDVIYFNPADIERPLGLNILDAKTEEGKHLVVNSFIGLLYKLYDPGHSGIIGPQLERAVRNVMLTAMAEPGNSMIEVLKLLVDSKFIETKIHLIDDPLVKSFWVDQMANTSEQTRSETLGYFVSKFDRFVTEKTMRNIIGQTKSAFDFREVMDTQKILLINLSKGLIGEENSNFLGLILVPRLLAAAMSRQNMAKEDRKDFFLYVDEFQNFATPDFAQILSEARKYRLSLTVANQFISQMQEEIRDAVFGNVGTIVSFRIGVDDAGYLEKQFEPVFKQNDLINQTIGNASVRLLINGQPSRPFSMKSDYAAIQALPSNKRVGEIIKEISRLKYGRDRRIIESEINARAGF